jgi:hypothetical protein
MPDGVCNPVRIVLRNGQTRDRVEVTGLRPLPLPHHRTCGFPHPAVGPGGSMLPQSRMVYTGPSGVGGLCLGRFAALGCALFATPPLIRSPASGGTAWFSAALAGCASAARSTSACGGASSFPIPGFPSALRRRGSSSTRTVGWGESANPNDSLHRYVGLPSVSPTYRAPPAFACSACKAVAGC